MLGESKHSLDAADKKEAEELTVEDRTVLTKYLTRHEKRACRWRYNRYVTLCFICLLYFIGFRNFLPAYNDAMTPLDEKAYIEQLRKGPVPTDDATARLWLAGYASKIAVIDALDRKTQSLALLSSIVGATMLATALIGTISLFNHWNDGERDIAMVRLIRGYVQKQAE